MAGAQYMERPKLVYVTPSHQYPLGITMSAGRRLELLSWARQNGVWIVEDDYNSEFRYASRPLASLQGLDDGGQVVYVGSFSKTLFPSLRLGYLVLPPTLVDLFLAQAPVLARPPVLEQAVVADISHDMSGECGRYTTTVETRYCTRSNVTGRTYYGRDLLTPVCISLLGCLPVRRTLRWQLVRRKWGWK